MMALAPPLAWAGTRPLSAAALDRRLQRLPLIAATVLSKIGIPGLGPLALTFSLPCIYLAMAAGLLYGRMVVVLPRLLVYLAVFAALWLMQALRDQPFSPASLLMLSVLHLPWVLALGEASERRLRTGLALRSIASLIAVLAVLQYGLQFLIGPTLAFPLDNFLPESMNVLGYNKQGPIEYGSSIYRANGVFMLEPSFLSQLMAAAIVGELAYGRASRWHIALFALAIALSYSGTGLLMLACCLPLWMVMRRQTLWALAAALAALLFGLLVASGAAADNPVVKIFVSRSSEFASLGSSGFARFVGGFYLFEQFLWPDTLRSLFGFGAGSFVAYAGQAQYAAHSMGLFKMVFEYGLVGALLYFGFVFFCLARSSAPLLMRVAVFVPLLIQNFAPFAHGLFIALLLWNSPPASGEGEGAWARA